ncbi:unnamed protein product [Sphagnum jensenii]
MPATHKEEVMEEQVVGEEEVVAPESETPMSHVVLNKEIPQPHYKDEETKFSFKTRKLSDAEVKAGVVATKKAPVILTLPLLTGEGLVAAMSDEKVFNLVLDTVNDVIRDAAKKQVNDEDNPVTKQEQLKTDLLRLDYIANQPKSARGGGISQETWTDFEIDYVSIMPELTGKEIARIEKAAALFVKRLAPVANDKPALRILQDYLSLWFANTSQQEELAEVFKFLDDKMTTLLTRDSSALVDALQILGAPDIKVALPDTVRGEYWKFLQANSFKQAFYADNAIHSSDSEEAAKRELDLMFTIRS